MELTHRQSSVYKFILRHHQKYGVAPTIREICEKLGLKGPAGVHRILTVLIEKGFVETMPGKKRAWRPVVPLDTARSIPLAGPIAAGRPIGIFDQVEEYLPVDPALYGHESCFAVRVSGDSMIGAQIRDGDLAILVPASDAENNTIVAVIVDEMLPEAVLKVFKRKRNTIELHSENSVYPPLIFKGIRRKKVRIVGKYVGLIRRN